MQRSSSFLFSLIFHLSIVVLVIFWPAPEPRKGEPLTGAMVQGIVTIGKAGGAVKAKPQQTPKDTSAVSKVPEESAAAEEKTTTAQTRVEPAPLVTPPKEVKPVEKTPEAPKVEPKTPPKKPVETPDAVKIAEKREDKPKEKPKEKAKDKPQEKPKTDTKKPEQKTTPPKDKKPASQKGSAAQQALADLNKDAKKPSSGGSGSSAASALKALESELGGGDGSGTASGSGYGEGGYGDSALIGSYTDSLVSRIRPNWSWTGLAVRQALQATYRIKITPDGTIESHELLESSGNSSFDATVAKAIALTRQVEPPPSSIPNGEIVVIFRPDALMQ